MVVECLVVIAILAIMCVLFWKVKRDQALTVLPLAILPAVEIISHVFLAKLVSAMHWDIMICYVIILVVAVIISGVFIGVFSAKLTARSNKIGYFAMSIIFNVVLATILINNVFVTYM